MPEIVYVVVFRPVAFAIEDLLPDCSSNAHQLNLANNFDRFDRLS